ncbi:hypothetical protein, partial [Streptomyces marokkonensis]|uniref:hypothetical protein n=1 Tax=Streptomyces marokkonensis TaxID=324855 RepID=UPI003CD09D18
MLFADHAGGPERPVPRSPSGAGRSSHKVGEGHVEDARDSEQREVGRVLTAGFDLLKDVPADASTQVQLLLTHPPGAAFGADALAEDTAVLMKPSVVVGCVHSTNRLTKIILSQ